MKSIRHVYNDDFYKITAVLLSKKFLALEKELQDSYGQVRLSIPAKGFGGEGQYREWLKKAMTLPNSPGKGIENILTKFNLDPKNEYYRNCLSARLFFRKMPWQDSIYPQSNITLTTRNSGKDRGLWVEIKPWTKKQDYDELWEAISMIQKSLIGYRGKEKFQITFGRDFMAYQLYLEVKKSIKPTPNPDYNTVMDKMAIHPEYDSLEKQFKGKGEGIDDQMRSINSRFNKLLYGIDIL